VAKFIPRFKAKSTNLNNSKSVEPGLTLQSGNKSGQKNQRDAPYLLVLYLLDQIKRLSAFQPNSKPPSSKPFYRRYLFWFGLGFGGSIIALSFAWWSLERSLPETTDLFTSVRDRTLTIKAADGTILQQRGPATRDQLKLEEIPKPLIQAFIASEDRRFYQHHGVDHQGIVRALFSNLQTRHFVEGGSTITQQLARIVFLNQERSLWRKLKEALVAQKIEQKLSKDQILERYLNLVYLGSGAYGVADAAWVYFSKPVNQLTLPEMAMFAGLAPAPSLYSPAVNPSSALQRRNLVLQRMHEVGFITAKEAAVATKAPLALEASSPKRLLVEAPYFTSYIQQELPKCVSPEVLEAGGLTVETTVNPSWQKIAEKVIKQTLLRNGSREKFEQAALIAIDPRNGEIRALVGGKDFGLNQFNRAIAQRQPGSAFESFIYTAAIATGKTPYDIYDEAPLTLKGYEPKNFSQKHQGWIDLRDALTYSSKVVGIKVLIDVGFEPTIQLAHGMGIKSELKPNYSLALDGSQVNLLELTSAYGTLATLGLHTEVHGIRRILNRRGEVIYSSDYKPKLVLDQGSAAIMTWMLRNVVQEGTGSAAKLDRPVAGKTGTSDEARDLWFIGYIPQLVAGIWLGNDNDDPTSGSSSTAAATWHEFMFKAVEGMSKSEFPEPPKLKRKGSIMAQPIKPKQVSSSSVDETKKDSFDNDQPSKKRYQQQYDTTSIPRMHSRRYRIEHQQKSRQSSLVRKLIRWQRKEERAAPAAGEQSAAERSFWQQLAPPNSKPPLPIAPAKTKPRNQ